MQITFIGAGHPKAIILMAAFTAELKGTFFSLCLGFIHAFAVG